MGYNHKKTTLNRKLILSFVAIILIVVVSIGITVNKLFETKFAEYIIKSNKKETSELVKSIESTYGQSKWDIPNIEEIGMQAILKGRVVNLYDNNNRLIWSAEEHNNMLCNQMIDNIYNNMNGRYPGWHGKYNIDKLDLKDKDGNYIGYLEIGSFGEYYYLEDQLHFLTEVNKTFIVITVIILIITIIIAILIAKSISKPISIVSNRAKSISSGIYKIIDYNSEIEEIDNLIKSVNDLSQNLEEQELLRKRLTTDISHELRTPLSNVQTHLEALIDGIWEPTEERLISINEEVIRLTSLVEQLKLLAKYDSEKSKLNLVEFNITQLIQNLVYNNQSKALEKNINIDFNSEEDIVVFLDKEKISQLILNLLSNAIRYTNSNGKVYIKLYKLENKIKIHIIDNGIGIPEENLKYIFERFYRVDESRDKSTGGIGIGLTISKSIVDLHKGDIEVKSKIDEGSEFIVTLPNMIK